MDGWDHWTPMIPSMQWITLRPHQDPLLNIWRVLRFWPTWLVVLGVKFHMKTDDPSLCWEFCISSGSWSCTRSSPGRSQAHGRHQFIRSVGPCGGWKDLSHWKEARGKTERQKGGIELRCHLPTWMNFVQWQSKKIRISMWCRGTRDSTTSFNGQFWNPQ